MNNQTQGPAIVIGNRWKHLEIGGEEAGMTIAAGDSLDGKRLIPTTNLLAAAYTSYDRAARELGVDAAHLAQTIDLAAMIRAAQEIVKCHDVTGCLPGETIICLNDVKKLAALLPPIPSQD